MRRARTLCVRAGAWAPPRDHLGVRRGRFSGLEENSFGKITVVQFLTHLADEYP